MSYDVRCFELAETFIDDTKLVKTPEMVTKLAQEIQDTIDDFLGDLEAKF